MVVMSPIPDVWTGRQPLELPVSAECSLANTWLQLTRLGSFSPIGSQNGRAEHYRTWQTTDDPQSQPRTDRTQSQFNRSGGLPTDWQASGPHIDSHGVK